MARRCWPIALDLLQGSDFAERLRTLRPIPGCHKLILVERCPLFYETASSRGKTALDHDSMVYVYDRFMFTVQSMEVWRIVVAEIDANGDAVKPAEFRHDNHEEPVGRRA